MSSADGMDPAAERFPAVDPDDDVARQVDQLLVQVEAQPAHADGLDVDGVVRHPGVNLGPRGGALRVNPKAAGIGGIGQHEVDAARVGIAPSGGEDLQDIVDDLADVDVVPLARPLAEHDRAVRLVQEVRRIAVALRGDRVVARAVAQEDVGVAQVLQHFQVLRLFQEAAVDHRIAHVGGQSGEAVGQPSPEVDGAHAAVGAAGEVELVGVHGQRLQDGREHAVDHRLHVPIPPLAVRLRYDQDEAGQRAGLAQAVVHGLEGEIAPAVAHAQVDKRRVGFGGIVVLGQRDVIRVAVVRRRARQVASVAAADGVIGGLEKPDQVPQVIRVLLEDVRQVAAVVEPILQDPERERSGPEAGRPYRRGRSRPRAGRHTDRSRASS